MGLYGPGPGPYEGKTLQEKHRFHPNIFLSKIEVFDLQTTFDGVHLFFRFLAEIRFRTIIKSPQKASSRTKNVQFWYLLHPALSYRLNLDSIPIL